VDFFCVIGAVVPKDEKGNPTAIVTVLLNIAKIAISTSFTIVYTYTAAVFPTVIRNSAMGFCVMASRLAGMSTPMISLLKNMDKCQITFELHVVLFGLVAIVAAIFGLFLPATWHTVLPQTLEEGEVFGKGNTAFSICFKSKITELTVQEESSVADTDTDAGTVLSEVDYVTTSTSDTLAVETKVRAPT